MHFINIKIKNNAIYGSKVSILELKKHTFNKFFLPQLAADVSIHMFKIFLINKKEAMTPVIYLIHCFKKLYNY